MQRTTAPSGSTLLLRASTWLDRPLASRWCAVGWLVATGVFAFVVALAGGPGSGDSQESVFATWALAHGHPGCVYPPADVPGFPTIAPLYVLYAAGMAAVLRIGHGVAFPTTAQFGAHCATATAAMRTWAFHSGAVVPTLWLGSACWLVLLAGVVVMLRTTRRGRTRWEPLAVVVVACAPGVAASMWEMFHPQDLASVGMMLIAMACVRRDRWIGAGVAIALAVETQQFALLLAVPLVVLAPSRRRWRYLASAAATLVVVATPVVAMSSGRAIPSVLVSTGEATVTPTLLLLTHLQGSALFSVERITPIAIAVFLAGWSSVRLGSRATEATPLLALAATALALRLLFQGNFYGYHVMAVAVMLIVLDAARGRLRPTLLAWFALVVVAWSSGDLDRHNTFLPFPVWFWQLSIAFGALALAAVPFVDAVRGGDGDTSEVPLEGTPLSESARHVGD
jgi:hypothetical protein